jgi:hypothetical protein
MCGAVLIVDPAEPASLEHVVKFWQVLFRFVSSGQNL